MEAPRNGVPATKTIVSMNENVAFASLQYSCVFLFFSILYHLLLIDLFGYYFILYRGSSFLAADETLRIRLEAKLTKSNTIE